MLQKTIYTKPNGMEIELRMNLDRSLEFEKMTNISVLDILQDGNLEKVSVATEAMTALLPGDNYEERKAAARKIFDELIDSGKDYSDFQELVISGFCSSGYLKPEALEAQKLARDVQKKIVSELVKGLTIAGETVIKKYQEEHAQLDNSGTASEGE